MGVGGVVVGVTMGVVVIMVVIVVVTGVLRCGRNGRGSIFSVVVLLGSCSG